MKFIKLENDAEPEKDGATIRQIKRWVRDSGLAPAESTIIVQQLRCADIGCPEVETVIAILTAGTRRIARIAKPAGRLAMEEVLDSVRLGMEGPGGP